ncbi:PKD domain-containing protein, partial [Bacteroidota bacterium]
MIIDKAKLHRLIVAVTIFLQFLFISNFGYAQCPVTAGFSYSINCTTVSFTNASDTIFPGVIDSCFWDFGDGGTSIETDPSHTYAPDDTYEVILTVFDTSGCYDTHTKYITLQPLPIAAYTFAPDSACPNTSVTFDASTTTGATSYQWNFGDGNTGSSSVTTHIYDTTYTNASCDLYSIYNVILTTTNTNGCTDTYTESVYVGTLPQPSVADNINVPPFSNCDFASASNPDFTLIVDNTTPNMACIDSINIEWGDGNYTYSLTSPTFQTTHTYSALGIYYLVVTAYSSNGCSNQSIYKVINEFYNPINTFGSGGGTQGCVPVFLSFPLGVDTLQQYNSPGTIYEYIWGDGISDSFTQAWANTATHIDHTYLNSSCPGATEYIVTAIVTNQCDLTVNTTSSIRISEASQAIIGTNDTNLCTYNSICFINNSILGVRPLPSGCYSSAAYLWTFGDGNTSTEFEPCHNYSTPGEYEIVLYSTDYCGTDSDTVTVLVIGTHAEFIADTACFGFPTQFTDLSYSYSDSTYTPDPNFPITNWSWDFGDGSPLSSDTNPSHTYANSGYFQVSLTVSNDYGCDSTYIDSVYVDDMQIDSVVVTPVECYNTNTGAIHVYSSLGIGLHTYTLNPGSISQIDDGYFDGLGPGIYTVTIEDEHGCQLDTTLTLQNPADISIVSVASTNITCHDYNDGTITVVGGGGTPPLSYTLQPDGVTNSTGYFDGLDAGVYSVEVTDTNLCAVAITPDITILNPDSIIIDSTQFVDNTCFDTINATISVYASGGTGSLYYTLWPAGTPIQTNNGVFTSLAAGTYYVTVTDSIGCPADTSIDFTVTNPPPISIVSVLFTHVTCNDSTNGTITVNASGGTLPLEYTLTPGNIVNNSGHFTGLAADTYLVSVTDSNG